MKLARKWLTYFIIIFSIFQLTAYLGTINQPEKDIPTTIDAIAYYIGFNLPLIIVIIMIFVSISLKKKIKKEEMSAMIDEIGKDD